MPVGYIFVCDAGGDVEHDDCALPLDVVSVAETSEFFLSSGIPYVEFDGSAIGVECEGVYFYSECCDVLLFEFSGKMTLHKGCFSDSSISDKNEFEFRNFLSLQWFMCSIGTEGKGNRMGVKMDWVSDMVRMKLRAVTTVSYCNVKSWNWFHLMRPTTTITEQSTMPWPKNKNTQSYASFFFQTGMKETVKSQLTQDHITSHSFGKNKDLGWVLSCHEK